LSHLFVRVYIHTHTYQQSKHTCWCSPFDKHEKELKTDTNFKRATKREIGTNVGIVTADGERSNHTRTVGVTYTLPLNGLID